MGQNKALLPINGTSLLEDRYRLLRSLGGDMDLSVWISGSYQHTSAIADKVQARGPIGGTWSVLHELVLQNRLHNGDRVLVIPVDMPLLDQGTIQYLMTGLTSKNAVHFADSELPCAFIYSPRVQAVLVEMIEDTGPSAVCSVHRLLRELGAYGLVDVDSQKLINTNTPDEWMRLKDESSTVSF
jgi:molybdopterin-guanine dinucleotide biosynthesis protein A